MGNQVTGDKMQASPAKLFDLEPAHSRSLTILNSSGRSTITWSPGNDVMVRQLIERKLQQGWDFWILKPHAGGLLGERNVKVRSLEEAMKARSFCVDDEDFARLITEGGVQLVTIPDRLEGWTHDAERSRDAAVIAASNAIGARKASVG